MVRFLRLVLKISLVLLVILLIAAYFMIASQQNTTQLSDAEVAVAGARAIYIEGALKNNPEATYASSNCEFNALNKRYMLVGLLNLQDKIDSGKATQSEIQELQSTVAHCH